MPATLPQTWQAFAALEVPQLETLFDALHQRPLTADTLDAWLKDWTALAELHRESYSRLSVAITLDTTDEIAEKAYYRYIEEMVPAAETAEQKLNLKLLESGLTPENFEVPLRNMRASVDLFREENLALNTELEKLDAEYNKIIGAQTVDWDGKEVTLAQLREHAQSPDRATRERAFRLANARRLQDRDALNAIWVKMLKLRQQIAENADLPDYREYKWRDLQRFDYTPHNAESFHNAIEEVCVPAAQRQLERMRKRMGVESLRPWDADWRLAIDPLNRPALAPYKEASELTDRSVAMFERVDPQFAEYVRIMDREGLLDLDNRKGKAPGGYCTYFDVVKRPFIFMNGVGLHDDVQTMLHEAGHCFHAFESSTLPYYQQVEAPIEFCEVASMAMELLAAPYLTTDQGGFYDAKDAARARVDHLEKLIRFWCYMAVVDGFQHWAYTHIDAASNPDNCDAKWRELWGRFMKGEDWSDLDTDLGVYWHRQGHLFGVPFYYIEYGLAQLGAVQVWNNSLSDHEKAVTEYRQALRLGTTKTLPELFAAAGAKFAFDAATMREAVDLIEKTIHELDPM
jgi:oligoendopeptidase F